jgi:hypothetical protein
MVRDSEMAIRNSQLLVDGMEQEAGQINSSQQRDRLLNAARMFFSILIKNMGTPFGNLFIVGILINFHN